MATNETVVQVELVKNDTLPNFGGSVDFDLTDYIVTLHIDFPIPLIKTATILSATLELSTFVFTFAINDLNVTLRTFGFEVQFDDNQGGIITYKKDTDGNLLKLKILDEIA